MVREFPSYHPRSDVVPSSLFGTALMHLANASVKAQNDQGFVEGVVPSGLFICQKTHQSSHPFGIFYGDNASMTYSFPLMLLEISFVVIATRIVRFLLTPLRQPRIVSEIIGGIIVGPSVLGRSKKFTAFMFPDNADFMVKNIGVMGFMYFLFVSGVKMDMTLITKTGKKQVWIALASVVFPMGLIMGVGFLLRPSMDKDLATISSLGAVSSSVAITAFPVLYPLLRELNLLSSDLGRMALSTSVISDAIGINALIAFESSKQTEAQSKNAGWYLLSMVFILLMLVGIRKIMQSLASKARNGKPVDQAYLVLIMCAAMSMGFLTDMFGLAIANGPMWLGLVIPDGPPLGSMLVERVETIASEILMPFSFAFIGMYTDVSTIYVAWPTLKPLLAMVVIGYVAKIATTCLACLYFKMSWKDSLALSFILSVRGQVELLLFIHWMDKQILQQSHFTLMVLLTTMISAICSPLISVLYDPTKPYMVNKKRTIQHTAPGTDLRVLLVILDQESVAGLVNLIEASNPTSATPFSITSLCLIELMGRANPIFIDHQKQSNVPSQYGSSVIIHNALEFYQETRSECIKLESYTVVTPRRTMYQDICEQALLHKSTLIILPFNSDNMNGCADDSERRTGVRSVNSFVLSHAPCSVGIFVDKGDLRNPLAAASFGHSQHHFAVLFLGGADAREALAYADRMLGNPEVTLTVVRFLSFNGEGDNEMEKKLDDGVVTWFWVKNEANNRVVYREVVVRNGAETVAAIQAVNDGSFDLWIVGRQQGINPVLLAGLSDWTENLHELGVIGDYVAASDFGGTASVLVIQQQILRQQGTAPTSCGNINRLGAFFGSH
ncbi:cation/H(+) antiporter 24-like [Humulus lupulus]|uniref:cation/H(+) antiporter 24-like n=1 Tax=Humulus lupulus TaxID=3486 RepID=UPI002B417193|nr:cation/H(+) antiporter 24-like [Humulus lupulus]